MTDNTPTFDVQDIFPDAADPVDEAFAQLREPHHLLAEALLTLRTAQDISRAIDASPVEDDENGERPAVHFDRLDRHRRLIDEGAELCRIAEVAGKLADGEQQRYALTDADLDAVAEPSMPDEYEPKPVRGVRFVAVVDGMPLGSIGHTQWLWSEVAGFLDIGAADEVDDLKAGGIRVTFRGVLKTVAAGMAIGVSNGGLGVLLPRACIIEGPDE